MSKYINVKQLYLLLFILGLYGLSYLMRGDRSRNSDSGPVVVRSNLEDSVRFLPYSYSVRAGCQAYCLGLTDTSIGLILKHGWIQKHPDSSLKISGYSLIGESVRVYAHPSKNELDLDSIFIDGRQCACVALPNRGE